MKGATLETQPSNNFPVALMLSAVVIPVTEPVNKRPVYFLFSNVNYRNEKRKNFAYNLMITDIHIYIDT